MRRDESAYAVLGLRPGAPREDIDAAYRRLMKQHHPDRPGGDAVRAAEINRAYSELRKFSLEAAQQHQQHQQQPRTKPNVKWRPPVPPPPAPPRRRSRAPLLALLLVGIAGLVVQGGWAMRGSWSDLEIGSATPFAERERRSDPRSLAALHTPVDRSLVDQAVADAVKFHASGDRELVDGFSQICFAKLREEPSVSRFDTCAAYDETIAILRGGSGDFDSGPFGATALTARQFAAARLLSDDYIATDSRLQQIRTRVEMNLLPKISDSGMVPQIPETESSPVPRIPATESGVAPEAPATSSRPQAQTMADLAP